MKLLISRGLSSSLDDVEKRISAKKRHGNSNNLYYSGKSSDSDIGTQKTHGEHSSTIRGCSPEH